MFKPHLILKNSNGVYLRRWFLTPWSRDDHPLKKNRLPNTYLHNMQQSDFDRNLHCHPWDNVSIGIWGSYIEHVFERPPIEGLELPRVIQKLRRAPFIVRRKAELAHRLELLPRGDGTVKPCWTIFITWRKRREWGFWTERNGVIGTQNIQRADSYVALQHVGKVAQWLHQKNFLARMARQDKGMS